MVQLWPQASDHNAPFLKPFKLQEGQARAARKHGDSHCSWKHSYRPFRPNLYPIYVLNCLRNPRQQHPCLNNSGYILLFTADIPDGKRANSLAEKGWEDFDGEPGRLVAEYAVRLLDALATMSKARSYILGEVESSV